MTLQEVILGTTPQDVYDRLSTMAGDIAVYPEDCCMCPLYHYFADAYPEEGDPAIYLHSVEFEEEVLRLPAWMTTFQERMIGDDLHATAKCETMGEAVAILEKEYGCE